LVISVKYEQFKILLVEHQDVFAELTRENLAQVSNPCFLVTHVKRLSEACRRLAEESYDVVLVDLILPDSLGLDTYTAVQKAAPAAAVVAMTGTADEELALEAVKLGAQDYLVKGQLDGRTLARVIRHAIERRRAQEHLRQREEFFRLITENIEDMVAVLDENGRRIYNNHSYQPLLGNPAELAGSNSFSEIHPDDRDRIERTFRQALASGEAQRSEFRFLLADGSVRHIESLGNALRDASGQASQVVVVSRDITERKLAEQRLRAALDELAESHQQLQATHQRLVQDSAAGGAEKMAAGVAREAADHLQSLQYAADFLQRRSAAGDSGIAVVTGEIRAAVRRLKGLLEGLRRLDPQPLTGVQRAA
jgi:PAS domain S-box-containing protein